MNHAQKGAWLGLIGGLISMIFIGILGYVLLKGFPSEKFWLVRVSAVAAVIFFFIVIFALPRKRRPNEPDADERDKQISLNAARICLLSLCLLIYISDVTIMFFSGLDGWIPASALPVIHFGVGYIAFTIYYAAVLILYGKDNQKSKEVPHESVEE